ncbi:MAG: hypothetical protein NTV32_06315 [Gammaproteobacteria bacterium]|nr:hypothetical protein [Gammaproteobacteria bacterium]
MLAQTTAPQWATYLPTLLVENEAALRSSHIEIAAAFLTAQSQINIASLTEQQIVSLKATLQKTTLTELGVQLQQEQETLRANICTNLENWASLLPQSSLQALTVQNTQAGLSDLPANSPERLTTMPTDKDMHLALSSVLERGTLTSGGTHIRDCVEMNLLKGALTQFKTDLAGSTAPTTVCFPLRVNGNHWVAVQATLTGNNLDLKATDSLTDIDLKAKLTTQLAGPEFTNITLNVTATRKQLEDNGTTVSNTCGDRTAKKLLALAGVSDHPLIHANTPLEIRTAMIESMTHQTQAQLIRSGASSSPVITSSETTAIHTEFLKDIIEEKDKTAILQNFFGPTPTQTALKDASSAGLPTLAPTAASPTAPAESTSINTKALISDLLGKTMDGTKSTEDMFKELVDEQTRIFQQFYLSDQFKEIRAKKPDISPTFEK